SRTLDGESAVVAAGEKFHCGPWDVDLRTKVIMEVGIIDLVNVAIFQTHCSSTTYSSTNPVEDYFQRVCSDIEYPPRGRVGSHVKGEVAGATIGSQQVYIQDQQFVVDRRSIGRIGERHPVPVVRVVVLHPSGTQLTPVGRVEYV